MTQALSDDRSAIAQTTDGAQQDDVFVFPTSFAQQRLWFLDQFEPGSPFYNIPLAARLRGKLDTAALEHTLNEIVRRHEVLRTTFATVDAQPVQVVAPALTLALPIVNLGSLPPDQREERALQLANEEARQPFHLARGPLLRTTLLRLDEHDHILLMTMHHIIADGWSMGVLINEIAALYTAFVNGQPSPLPELPIQYADFAAWQREWLQGESDHSQSPLQAQLAYWQRRLGGDLPVLDLPTDRPRPAVQTSCGSSQSHMLPADLTDALKALCRQEGTTLFMTLLAAFNVLLYRYSGQEDLCVGTPIANRTRAELEPLIGFFVNTLVLRTDLAGNPPFRTLLQRVREVTLGAYAHQDLPFEMLVEALQPERDMSHTPLFQVMFILQNTSTTGDPQELPGLTLDPIETHTGTSTFDLTMSVAEEFGGLEVTLEYNTDLFDAATITRMAGHFQTLLQGIVANPETPIATLPLLTAAERRQLLVEWNATQAPWSLDHCVHQRFEQQAARTPDAIAVVSGSERMTYGELNQRANQLAHHLQTHGVGPETVVALALDRTPDLFVAILGILKAGGAYLPLDPAAPPTRLAQLLADARPALLLTRQTHLAHLPATAIPHLCLDTDWPAIACQPTTNPASAVRPDHLAYVIFTSGSTGAPKGVLVTHRSLLNAALAWEAVYQLRPGLVHLQLAPATFDVCTGDLVRALCFGGTLVICPRDVLLDSPRLYALMRQEQVDCVELVPAVLRLLLSHLEETDQRLDFLRLLICGSDTWTVGEYQRVQRRCGPATRLINSFGLTEATIDSTYFEDPAPDLPAEQLVPIGRPFPSTQVYLLDAQRQPVPIGVPGELYIGGAGVARGYLHQPDLTAERFVPNPFGEMERWSDGTIGRWGDTPIPPISSTPPHLHSSTAPQLHTATPPHRHTATPPQRYSSTRLYRTGDRARYRPDGTIEFLGRADHQVKIRGVRIAPGEIEAVLAQHPDVQQVVVLARPDAQGAQRLVAYVVPAPTAAPTPTELRHFTQAHLPELMVPSAFVLLDALPLTPSGKVDRQALPAPDWSQRDLTDPCVAPRTPTEELLTTLWQAVLGVAQVGVHDNFFALGGHSLLATQLVARIREACKVELPLRSIFEAPTIAALAEQVEAARQRGASGQAPPIRPVPRDGAIPLSFAQQRLWFLDQLEPDSSFYNIPETMRLRGPLDVALLERTLNEIVRRHEVLRTNFVTVDGRPAQVIAPELRVSLTVTDLQALAPEEREAAVRRLANQEAQQPFNLAQGPLFRARLLRLAADDHVIIIIIHHIISDDWSTSVLMGELATIYAAFADGRPSPLPDLPIQYADFAAWQRQWLQSEVLESQLAYWKQQLAGSPPLLELPTDRPRPPVQTFRGTYQLFEFPPRLSQALKALGQREGTTLFMTLLAAFKVLLARYSGQEDICVGTPIANRTRRELEPLIGFFVNTLVLRSDLSGAPTFRDLLKQVREVTLGAYAHQDLPFEMVVDAIQPERNLSYTPLFQVAFALQNTPFQAQELPDLTDFTLTSFDADIGTAKVDMTLFISETGDRLAGALEYNTDLFDTDTITRLLGHFETLLEGVVADPDRPIISLPLLSEAEQRQLLVEWNATAADFPDDRCVQHLFEAQVVRAPDAIAATFADQQLTYGELNRHANQLAHYLQKQGVQPDTLVGISVERSFDLVVAVLGVLKAGGAYVPLDPAYPPERLAFMLADAQVAVLLTHAAMDAGRWTLDAGRWTLDAGPRTTDHGPRTTDSAYSASAPRPIVVRLDADWPSIAREPDTNPASAVTPDDLAYVIYTSGSTGQPKGAMLAHRGVCNLAMFQRRAFDMRPGKRVLQFAPFSFDASVWEIVMALCNGATLCLAPQAILASAPDLLRLLEEQAITTVTLPPSLVAVLAPQPLPHLETLITAGEACTTELVARWAPGRRFFNAYGPTETTVCASVGLCDPNDPRPPSIGRPIDNFQLYILDPHQQPVPIGVPGELYIGGVGVARGYLHRPELTAEKFVPNPFEARERGSAGAREPGSGAHGRAAAPHAPPPQLHTSTPPHLPSSTPPHLHTPPRLYRTGDRARYRPDGTVEFLGRIDHQVKVRGFRIELGEIEAALRQHPAVQDAAVIVREDTPGDKRLVAYMVLTTGPRAGGDGPPTNGSAASRQVAVGASELRAFLKDKLPEYMVPAAFVTLDAFPLTPSGKVDRRALPAPDSERPDVATGYAAPRTPTESTLANIWAQVLGVAQVGIHDNFFELGGDSILGIQVIARAGQAGLHLSPRHLFQAPTVAELAALAGTGQAIHAEQGIVTGPVPLTPIQHWFFAQNQPVPQHWNQSLFFATRLRLQRALLEEAVRHLVTHHDALRLRFTRDTGGWQQFNAGVAQAPRVDWVDLSALPTAAQGPALEAAAGELQAGLNLEQGPLLRVAYFDLGAEQPGRLLLIIHHLAVDGVSWRIVLEDLQTAYQQLSRGEAVQLPPKTTAYRDWARRLVEHAQTEAVRSELAYWLEASAAPAAHLPLDLPGGENTEASARSIVVALSVEETRTLLHDVPAVYRTEINDALLMALAQALSHWTASRSVVIDLEGHGREDLFADVDLTRTVGWFTTLFPVHLDLEHSAEPGEMLVAVKEQLRRIPHRGIGYGLLRYLARDPHITTALQALSPGEVSFNYLGQVDQAVSEDTLFDAAHESAGAERSPQGWRSHLLDINGQIAAGQLHMEWTFSANLHRQATIERVAQDFVAALRSLIAHCRSPAAEGTHFSATDFAEFGWSPEDFEHILTEIQKSA